MNSEIDILENEKRIMGHADKNATRLVEIKSIEEIEQKLLKELVDCSSC